MRKFCVALLGFLSIVFAVAAQLHADSMKVEAVLTPKEQIKLNFEDGSGHFVLLVRREGVAGGSGPLADASVVEFGMHDIVPGVAGDPRGYLVFTDGAGDKAYVKWSVRAVFVPGEGGKPRLLDNGVWEVAGGTGKFAGMRGAGTLHIKPETKTDRRFILEGELIAGS